MTPENPPSQVKDLGEQGLLKLVQQYCPASVVGDDAAVLAVPADHQLVVTTDVLVEGVHFSDRTMSATDVGWKAAAVNLSDLAAMGATPLGITVGLALPADKPVSWVEQLYEGLSACLQINQTPILGGDISRSPITLISITALGTVAPEQVIQRSQAKPGDVLVTTGVHGASKAGLELLLNPQIGLDLSEAERKALIDAHQRPSARLDVSSKLWGCLQDFNAGHIAGHIAGMDSSDGLADAILQICRASGVGARIERSRLPQPACFDHWLLDERSRQWCLYGGEDYELVLAMPKDFAEHLQRSLSTPVYVLGEITANPEVLLVDSTYQYAEITLDLTQGYQHFQSKE